MNNTTDLNSKQDGCSKGILCRLINSCCATGATVASDTTASTSAKTPNFRLAFPTAFVVVAAQLDDMSSMYSSMSDQSPLTLTVPAEPTENDFIDNYDLDGNDNDYSLSEKIVHFLGGYIAPEHWLACKAVLVFHAGSKTSKLASSMNKTAKVMACLLAYKQAIAALDSMHFSVESRKYCPCSFKKKDEPMTSETLYRYYLDSRSKMRCAVIPLSPVNFVSMTSGKGFHDTRVQKGIGLEQQAEPIPSGNRKRATSPILGIQEARAHGIVH